MHNPHPTREDQYRWWFEQSSREQGTGGDLCNDFWCNDNLLRVFGRRTIIDIPYLIKLEDRPSRLGPWLQHPWNRTRAIVWGIEHGLVSPNWTLYRFRLLDRRQQFVEIGPMSDRGAVRITNPKLPRADLEKLLTREKKRQERADRRTMVRNAAIAKEWLELALYVNPNALLPEELSEFGVVDLPYLSCYREILLEAAGSRVDTIIGSTLFEITVSPRGELATSEAHSAVISDDDADAIGDLGF